MCAQSRRKAVFVTWRGVARSAGVTVSAESFNASVDSRSLLIVGLVPPLPRPCVGGASSDCLAPRGAGRPRGRRRRLRTPLLGRRCSARRRVRRTTGPCHGSYRRRRGQQAAGDRAWLRIFRGRACDEWRPRAGLLGSGGHSRLRRSGAVARSRCRRVICEACVQVATDTHGGASALSAEATSRRSRTMISRVDFLR